jgi:hypothetical protein
MQNCISSLLEGIRVQGRRGPATCAALRRAKMQNCSASRRRRRRRRSRRERVLLRAARNPREGRGALAAGAGGMELLRRQARECRGRPPRPTRRQRQAHASSPSRGRCWWEMVGRVRLQPEKRERARLRPEKKGRMDLAGDEGEGRAARAGAGDRWRRRGWRREERKESGAWLFFFALCRLPLLLSEIRYSCITVTSNVRNAKRHMPC